MSKSATKFLEVSGILSRNDPIGAPGTPLNHQDDDTDDQPTHKPNTKFLVAGLVCVFMVFFSQFTHGTIVFLLEHLILKVILISLFGYVYGLDNGVYKLDQCHALLNCFLKERCRSTFQYFAAMWRDKIQ